MEMKVNSLPSPIRAPRFRGSPSLTTPIWICLLVLAFQGIAGAQSFFGAIGGAVRDASGAGIPDVQLTLTETATNVKRSAVTNAEGNYQFPSLLLGSYAITASKTGFKEARSEGIRVATQQVVRLDLALEVGDTKTSIEVVAEAASINYENARVSDVRPREQALAMPVNSRSTLPQLYLTSYVYDGDSIGGVRNNNVNYTVDGVTANSVNFGGRVGNAVEVSLEAVHEVTVLTSNNSAEFPKAASMYVSTRGGTNQLHGSAFFEHSNWLFNARNFFAGTKPKGPTRHEYGFGLGGPITLPKIYNGRNRTFFFINWEHIKPPGLSDNQANVPTLKMRSGDFSDLLPGKVIRDLDGNPFQGNIIPSSRFSPVAQKILNYNFIPLPNYGPASGFALNYRDLRPPGWTDDRYSARIDHTLNSKDSLSGRLTMRRSPAVYYDNNLPAFTREQNRKTVNMYVSETHLFTPAVVNEVRFGYTRDYSYLLGKHKGAQVVQDWGLQGINLSNKQDLTGVPNITFLNFSQIQNTATYFWRGQTYEALDNLSWARGKHMLKTGFMLRYNLADQTDNNTTADFGSYAFNNFATGFDFADFLLGVPQTTTRVERAPERNQRFYELGVYVQDDWRVTNKLTLNFGLRYDYGAPPVDRNDRRYAFNPLTGQVIVPNDAALAKISPFYPKNIPIVTAAAAGYPERSLVYGDKNNLAPRFGFAYRAMPKTVIRGGYGIYYTNLLATLIDRFTGGPFGGREIYNNAISNGSPLFQFPNPFLSSGTIPGQSISGVTLHPQASNMQQWNLTLERELGSGFVARIDYRGFRTNQLGYEGNINKPLPSANSANAAWYRFPWFANANLFQSGAIQKMHSMDVGVERKFAKSLMFQSGWTWTKNLADAPGGSDGGTIENPYDRAREMSNTPSIPRHRWVTSAVWEVPFGTGKRFGSTLTPILRETLGNWSISGITVAQSGFPLTPTFSSLDPSNTRTFGGRADWVGDWRLPAPTIDRWYNTAAFAVPSGGRYGNAAPSIVFGPGIVNFNFGLFKTFNIRERAHLQFRMTANNIMNHPNFGDPNMNISSSTAGKITSTRGGDTSLGAAARVIRLGLRLEF